MVYSFISSDVNECREWLTMFGFNIVEVNKIYEKWTRPNGDPGTIVQHPNDKNTWQAIYASVD